MNFRDLYSKLDQYRYYIFSLKDILFFYPKEKEDYLRKMVYRWKKKRWIYPLKRGLYEITYPREHLIPDMYIANKLYGPSCVSLETALSNYSIIPEVSMAVTSITTKPTRRFQNKHGLFLYRTVKPDIFTGYYVEKQGLFEILIAEPEKALVDYLYFKTYRTYRYRKFNLEEERLDKDVISGLNRRKLEKYSKLYNINLKEFYAHI
jgi:predicted transcriptional regulator of viral defense system